MKTEYKWAAGKKHFFISKRLYSIYTCMQTAPIVFYCVGLMENVYTNFIGYLCILEMKGYKMKLESVYMYNI